MKLPWELIEYIRQFTGPEPVFEVSYSLNILPQNEYAFINTNINLHEPMYFADNSTSILAKKFIRENPDFFKIRLKKIITHSGNNEAIVINGVPHLIFKISNFFQTYDEFEQKIMQSIIMIKSQKSKKLKLI
jgi:hypothetical protein